MDHLLPVAEEALERAGVVGVIPTPLRTVGESGGIRDVVDIGSLSQAVTVARPGLLRRVLGAYIFREETAFVDLSQARGRARFTEAHEIGHKIIPWHEAAYYLDDNEKLFKETKDLLEEEANAVASFLIFQGRTFGPRALEYETSIKTPILLSDLYGASIHATIRYYVKSHTQPLALALAGRIVRPDGSLPVYLAAETESFRREFGAFAVSFPNASLYVDGQNAGPLAPLVLEAMKSVEPAREVLRVPNLAGTVKVVQAEAFFNQHSVFVMLSPKRIVRMGRRVRIQPASRGLQVAS